MPDSTPPSGKPRRSSRRDPGRPPPIGSFPPGLPFVSDRRTSGRSLPPDRKTYCLPSPSLSVKVLHLAKLERFTLFRFTLTLDKKLLKCHHLRASGLAPGSSTAVGSQGP